VKEYRIAKYDRLSFYIKRIYLGALLLLSANVLTAKDKEEQKKIKVLPVPAFGYAPETKTYLGAVSLFTLDLYQDSLTRESNAKVEVNYTWNRQIITETEWSYFFREEKWFTQGKLHFSDYPDLYYGVGANTKFEDEITYQSKRIVVDFSVLKSLGNDWFSGPSVKFLNFYRIKTDEQEIAFPELKSNRVFGLGYSFMKDSRNSLLTPTNGVYYLGKVMYDFSAENYWEALSDFRFYKSWNNKFTLANRFLCDLTVRTPPFFDNSTVGGDKYVRGYYLGRFRDKNLTTWQSEFRFPVYRRFHSAVFGGMSAIFGAIDELNSKSFKPNYGLGIRYLVDKDSNTFLRFDYGLGEGNAEGFYISFGESF